MEITNKYINIIGILSAVIFVLLSDAALLPAFLRSLFSALGTGLFAACLVNIIISLCADKEPEQPLTLITNERIDLTKYYRKKRAEVKNNHDLLSIAVAGALKDISADNVFIDKVLQHRLKVRLMLLNPNSSFVLQRAAEDQITVAEVYKELSESIELAVRIGEKLKARHAQLKKSNLLHETGEGSFEVRLYDGSPYLTIFRADDELIWGLYTAERRGVNSAAFRSVKGGSMLSNQLESHFNVIWERSRSTSLVRYVEQNTPVVVGRFAEQLRHDVERLSAEA